MRLSLVLLTLLVASPVMADPADAYVRVSPRDRRYLELTDGTPYIPIGLNMIGPPNIGEGEGAAFKGLDEWLTSLSANGGNYIRVWLSSPFWAVEHEKSGVYDESRAQRIDRLLEMCRRHGIRVKFTMEHFRSIGGGKQSWADEPLHNVTDGGTAQSIADFFDGEPSRALFRRKIEWYAKRIGQRPEIYAWELWNEINAVNGKGDVMAWTQLMLPELHRAFPKNMAVQSLGSFDRDSAGERYRALATMEGNDVAQVHRYLDLGAKLEVCHGPVDILVADAVRTILSYHPERPVILAESGAVEPGHAGPSKLYPADHAGILLHDILFAPFFSGAAGAGQIWHWDAYVAANNLWYHFGRFAEVVRGLDPPAEAFEPMMAPHDRLRVYVLRGRHTVLAWCRDSKNTWESELKNGEAPEVIKEAKVNLSTALKGRKVRSARFYDPWLNQLSNATVGHGEFTLPEFSRSMVIRISVK
jgi:hypothetical protein